MRKILLTALALCASLGESRADLGHLLGGDGCVPYFHRGEFLEENSRNCTGTVRDIKDPLWSFADEPIWPSANF
jgi:hypothetical protein